LHRRHQRLVIGQGRALDGVAVVEQQGVGVLFARIGDQRGRAVHAVAFVLGQLVVVVAQHVGMQVGGAEDGHVQRGTLGHARLRRRLRRVTVVIIAATGGQARQQRGAGGHRKDLS
jgi:hypothetical protein